MSQALLAPGVIHLPGQYEHTFETGNGGITVGIAFPESETWRHCEQAAQERWTQIFGHHGLTAEVHREMYDPYGPISIMFYGRVATEAAVHIDGLSQIQLPNPNATTIYESGFKTVIDATKGDASWGKIDISQWNVFDEYPPLGLFDVLIHYSGSLFVTPFLESLQADLSIALASMNQPYSDRPLRAGIATNIVTILLNRMQLSHNHTNADGKIIRGIHALGLPSSYGAGEDKNNHVTAVLIDTEASIMADVYNPGTNRLIPNVLELVCPRRMLAAEIDKIYHRGAYAA